MEELDDNEPVSLLHIAQSGSENSLNKKISEARTRK